MKNYNKKLIIMFVMLLTVIGFGTIQNGTVANAATIGGQLKIEENGWKRIDNVNSKIIYNSFTQRAVGVPDAYRGTDAWANVNGSLNFKFYGTKLRIIGVDYLNSSNNVKITIDGKSETFDCSKFYGSIAVWQVLQYEKNSLTQGVHDVTITSLATNSYSYYFDCIDIDDYGYLIDPNESITLDNSSMDLTVNTSKQLTATTTPADVGVTWTSSDSNIASVDSTGKITGVKEGQVSITATTAGGVTATCTVNVTTSGTTEPTDPTSDGTLFIELVDGNIKSYDVTADQITNFINWYKNRDNDDSELPYYKFTKGTYKDYVIHDKIDWFEVR
jgi:uncharacterized protein YjdB